LVGPEFLKLPLSTREKILLTRNIVHKPRLLILEDGFEAIVPDERKKIIDFLCDSQRSWTLLAVSSDPYFQDKCNRKINLKKNQ